MKEIKFRAWDKKKKEMYFTEKVRIAQGKGIFAGFQYPVRENIFIYEWELMQYTGLKDKNGKEIYEGDIIIYNDKIKTAKPRWSKPVVIIWNLKEAKFDFKDSCFGLIYCDYEVIGNIYEAPSLLEEIK